MSEKRETVGGTLLVAIVLCIVCGSIVATASVLLRPQQIAAQERDRNINILQIAHIYEPELPVEQQMEQVQPRVVNLNTGTFSDDFTVEQVVDAARTAKNPALSTSLSNAEDIARIGRRENYSVVYLIYDGDQLSRILLPVRGYGLWSTMWGYLALESDLDTVVGLGFYQHGETPGLGGEIENPRWREQWEGKHIYDENGQVAIQVLKGQVDPSNPRADHQIDGLSGATLTTNGVSNMMRFWLGDQGWGKFIKNLQAGEA